MSYQPFLVATMHPTKDRTFLYTGIDRKNPNFGYTEQNSVPCCSSCNQMKWELNLPEWTQILENIVKRHKDGIF